MLFYSTFSQGQAAHLHFFSLFSVCQVVMEVFLVAKKVRSAIIRVGTMIEPLDRRLTVPELVAISVKVMPSTLGVCFSFVLLPFLDT